MNDRSYPWIAAACLILASCSAPSVSPQLQEPTSLPYTGQAQALPYAQNAYSGTLSLPASSSVPQGDVVTLISSQIPFAAPPALQDELRRPQTAQNDVPLLFFDLSSSKTISLPSPPSFTIILPSNVSASSGPFYVAFYDPTARTPAWNYTFAGPGVVSGSTVTFTPPTAAFTMQAGAAYFFCIYQQVGATASPTPTLSATPSAAPTATASPTQTPAPSPAPSPSPTPQGPLSLSSSALSLNGVGGTYGQHVSLQETGYAGSFFESDTCSSIATIAMSSDAGPDSLVTVTGVASGNCNATFRDALGQSAALSVSVTVSGFSVSMTTRKETA